MFGHLDAMKVIYVSITCVLLLVLVSCGSTRNESPSDSAWMQIQPGVAKQEVYAKLGQPFRETGREVEWRRPEGHGWRVVVISFDANGRVAVVRGQHEQK